MIKSTEDYSVFKKNSSNRDIDQVNLKKIVNSIKIKNLLELRPLVVNSNMEIIDGQHRLEAAKILSLAVYYTVRKEIENSDIILLNSAQKPWILSDYIQFYAKEGKKNYQKIVDVSKKYNTSINDVLLLAGLYSGGATYKELKQGNLEKPTVDIEKEVTDKIYFINHTLDYLEQKTMGNKRFLKSRAIKKSLCILMNHENFSFEVFKSKLQHGLSKFHSCFTYKEYEKMFKAIYNFRNNEPLE